MAERNDELLSSFNVATFKSDEDDQAFWNRLIPVDQRAKDQAEAQEHLGIRTARLSKFADDVCSPTCKALQQKIFWAPDLGASASPQMMYSLLFMALHL